MQVRGLVWMFWKSKELRDIMETYVDVIMVIEASMEWWWMLMADLIIELEVEVVGEKQKFD